MVEGTKVTDKINLTCEDNMDLMARYPDNYFELAIVDPPYGINGGSDNRKTITKSKNSFTYLPAIAPNVTGVYGNRKVVVPKCEISCPVSSLIIPRALTLLVFP